jgi:hypothetical protein
VTQSTLWSIDAQHASLTSPVLGATVELLDPAHGLHDLQWRRHSLAAVRALLGLSFETRTPLQPELLLDAYGRQGDLVVSYAQSARQDVAVQAYWRVSEFGLSADPVVDLQTSVQTALLDSVPSIYTYNVAQTREVWLPRDAHMRDWVRTWQAGSASFELTDNSAPICLVLRLAAALPQPSIDLSASSATPSRGDSVSLIVMVRPGDLRSGRGIVDPTEPERLAIVCQQLHEHLEKGVIRRVWQRTALVDSARDLEFAGELYRSFVAAAPSLTV